MRDEIKHLMMIEICIYLGAAVNFFAGRRRVAVYGSNVDLPI